ncbi:hypothetical protein N0V88_003932 [Collariella sp. IMI 366227]|nr:hypothetical protein N0V88_003932 [Collariella sp. IMI 366227]
MDAAALLKSQGWRGKGFSLHPTNNTIGLSKPILVSRNTDGRGIGQKQHHTSDQWWLNAFDEKLKGLDTSKGTVVQAVTQGKLDVIASSQPNGKYTGTSGLYACFVRGGMLQGTVDDDVAMNESTDATPATSDSDASISKIEKRGETKAERAVRKAMRRIRKAEKLARRAPEAKAARKAAKKELKKTMKASETREERRARRVERRARKEAKRRKREREAGEKPEKG